MAWKISFAGSEPYIRAFHNLTFSFAVVLCIANIAGLRSGENLAFMKVLNENTNTSFFLGIEGMTALPKY